MQHHSELYNNAVTGFNRLALYRNLTRDPVLILARELFTEAARDNPSCDSLADLYFDLASNLIRECETLGLDGNLLRSYIVYRIIKDENIFALASEKNGRNIERSLLKVATRVLHGSR